MIDREDEREHPYFHCDRSNTDLCGTNKLNHDKKADGIEASRREGIKEKFKEMKDYELKRNGGMISRSNRAMDSEVAPK